MKDVAWLVSVCSENGLKIDNVQAGQLESYSRLLLSWNQNINLISRKDEENVVQNHILNSISFLFFRELRKKSRILDLGTGGGLPGIPLKILMPDIEMVLLDSIAKKTAALSAIVDGVGLKGVGVATGRAEELAPKREFHAVFDYVVSRAAGKLEDVVKWSRGFLKESESPDGRIVPVGTLLVLKGGDFEGELKHTRSLKFVGSVEVVDLNFLGMDEANNFEKKLVLVGMKPASRNSGRQY